MRSTITNKEKYYGLLSDSHIGNMLDMAMYAIEKGVPFAFVKQSGSIALLEVERVGVTVKGQLFVAGIDAWSRKVVSYRLEKMRDSASVPPKGGWPE